ncbi:GNAT family N-acetyltransferase [Flavobacterium degerlachei]|jgi:ribosomal protein S18 acetylase RimI-like enzyme|uniref:Acetyltransferase (GNAT) family protein n=1 Tax=Flavobacterium degerlachei TaxID=229203 RepID=A0A1H3A2N4_9FLAO|nr:GNAT family N-acetyltransferase [Flavobacterium degerlachei]SDX23464.1 Acetyltransferase (GNAT) family protein [Flavobacterium degerlachei]
MAAVKIAVTDQEIRMCWEALYLLRPMLQPTTFLDQIKEMQKEGYVLLYVFEHNKVVSIAGYRIYSMLYCGKILYIDDLSTLESARGNGHATTVLKHLYEVAAEQDCKAIHLDSGHSRTAAHKLYLKEDFTISAFHFSKPIN